MIEQIAGGLLIAQADAGAAGPLVSMLPILLMFGVIYFLMIRPQQKQAKQHRTYLDSLKSGDEVVTNAGIFGRIVSIAENVVTLEVARDVKLRVLKSQIAGPQPGTVPETVTAKKD